MKRAKKTTATPPHTPDPPDQSNPSDNPTPKNHRRRRAFVQRVLSGKTNFTTTNNELEADDSWIPASFKRGMADVKAGRLTDLDTR